MKVRRNGLVVTVILSILLASCGQASPTAPAAQTGATAAPTAVSAAATPASKVFKLGVMSPYTGASAREGNEHKNAYTMAFDAINWTIGDYKIEPVWIDDEGDPEKAVRAYEAAVLNDKIDAGTYGWYSSVSMAVIDVVAKYKIPHFFGGGSSSAIVDKVRSDPEKYSYWIGKHWANFDKLQVGYLEVMESAISSGMLSPEDRTIIVGSDLTEGAVNQVKLMREVFEKAGWTTVDEEHWATGETDFFPLMQKVSGMNASVLYVVSTPAASFDALVKAAGQSQLKMIVIADGLGWNGTWYEDTGDAGDYVVDMNPVWKMSPKALEFEANYKQRFGAEPGPSNAGLAYDWAGFLIKVLQRTYDEYGELTKDAVYKVGTEEVMTGELTYTDGILMKEYKFTPETAPDPVVGPDNFTYPIVQYFGGNPTVLWPPFAKEADLKLPPAFTE
jgi:branched-chain amino acid transport system substrate-binding protein